MAEALSEVGMFAGLLFAAAAAFFGFAFTCVGVVMLLRAPPERKKLGAYALIGGLTSLLAGLSVWAMFLRTR
ncbi:hypothetical protein LVJ94_09750 [Pendulispora rubella]|uniref:DUF4190 domain-containing protein n=1 Tax=Pendulispora rubella TaxID=2741070 RepID=A0ABZ2LCJ8_9BACT